jgi:kumamolisin
VALLHHIPPGSPAKILARTDETNVIRAFLRLRRRPGHDHIPDFSEYVGCPPRQRLPEAEFAARYGASDDDIATLKAHYAQFGLHLEHHSARRHLYLSGPVSAFNAAFGVTLYEYEKQHGKETVRFRSHAEKPKIPDHVAHMVLGVHELENEPKLLPSVSPLPTVYTNNIAPATLAAIYKFPTSYSGAGQIIAVYVASIQGLAILTSSHPDLAATCSAAGVSVPTTSYIVDDVSIVPNTSPSFVLSRNSGNPWSIENWLDVSMIAMFAPGAQIVTYLASNILTYAARLANPDPGDPAFTIGSMSVAGSENDVGWPAGITDVYQDCAIQGVTLVNASGDFGPLGQYSTLPGFTDPNYAQCTAPSNDPYVLSVGGTIIGANSGTLSSSNFIEWLYANGPSSTDTGRIASAGGVSNIVPKPSYQSFAMPAQISPAAPLNGAAGRGTPDISALMDAAIRFTLGGSVTTGGGTSQSCPIVASMIACCNHALGFNVGFINPTIYALSSNTSLIRRLNTGGPTSNSVTEAITVNGLPVTHQYPGYALDVTKWSPGAGLGVLQGQGLVSVIQAQAAVTITGINVSQLSVGGATNTSIPAGTAVGTVSVTTTGGAFIGWLSIGGADHNKFAITGITLTTLVALPAGAYAIDLVATQPGATGSPFTRSVSVRGLQVGLLSRSIAPLNQAFTVQGTLAGYAAPPSLQYQDNNGAWIAFPGGSNISTFAFDFLHPAIPTATASFQLAVRDANLTTATGSTTFSVAAGTITLNTISNQTSGSTFTIIGSLSGFSSAPTLQYRDDSGAFNPFPTPPDSTVFSNSFFFNHPATLAPGTHTVTVSTSDGATSATSNSFAVTGIAITGISLSGTTINQSAVASPGALVATVTVSQNSGVFAGSLTVSGRDAASFGVSGSNLTANVPLSTVGSPYVISITATPSDSSISPVTQPFTITIVANNIIYILEEANAAAGPWAAVSGSPFSTTSDLVGGLSSGTAYYFRLTARDVIIGINSAPTVVGPFVTSASTIAESPQNTRLSQTAATTVPPVGTVSALPSGGSLSISWSIPVAIYDAGLNGWSLYASGTTNGVQVARDGTVFQTTSGVQNIVYWNHNVWMQTSAGWFYYGGDALGGNWIPGPGDPAITTSLQQTDVTDTVATIIGTAGGSWQISSSGQVVHSGVADSSTTGTVELLFWNSTVYRKTGTSWFLFNGAWVSAPVDPRTNSALGQSPSGTFVPNTTWLIVDATGAVWRMTGTSGSFTIIRSNLTVQSASNVVELLYYQSAVYQAKVSQTSVAFPGSGSFTDNSGNVWSIDSGGNILRNGVSRFWGEWHKRNSL